ncbi:MAG: hypothetical protein K9L30_03435 [Desulfobacterales bacterium]|nr:hypothetical protein [Desulfobacterales bacterium]
MKIIFVFLIIILFAFSGYHLTFRDIRLPRFARRFYLTGTEYLFLGLLMGPLFFNLLDDITLNALDPLCALILGWIGLLFGFQFELPKLRRFPLEFFTSSIFESILTSIVVFFGVYHMAPYFYDMGGPVRIMVSLSLAAAAACTAQTGLSLLAPHVIKEHQDNILLLRYISSIDGLSAMTVLGIAYYFRMLYFPLASRLSEPLWGGIIVLMTCIGLLFLYILFLSQRHDEGELALIVIGMVIFTSGTASLLNFSPLLANFFMGFCLVNITREKERIFQMLISVEKPVYLLLLFFLGAGWIPVSIWIVIPAAAYCIFRAAGKLAGGYAVTHISPGMKQYPEHLGFGLLEQGGLAPAILLDFNKSFPFDVVPMAISVVLVAIIFNDFISAHFMSRLLKEEK